MPNIKVDLPGINTNVSNYSFTVNVPSMDPTNSEGSSGSISFDTGPLTRPQHYRNGLFTLTDSRFGGISGRVSEIGFGSGSVNFTAETVFQRLTATSTIKPKFGASTLACMTAVLALGGFTCDGLDNTNSDVFPGWSGSILNYLQMFCAARQKEYVVEGTILHFRPIRGANYTNSLKSISFTLNDQSLAQNIEVVDYACVTGNNIEFFPAAAQDVTQVLTVETDGRIVYDVKINGWVETLNQPTQTNLVGPGIQDGTTGTYCVSANDGLPITTGQWSSTGGRIFVESTNDPSVIRITVWGPSGITVDGVDPLSPYSIAASAGDGVYYNALHITGRGIRYTPTTHRLATGATSDTTIEELGATVENPFLSTLGLAYDVGLRSAQTFAGPNYQMSGSTKVAQDYTTILGSRFDSGQGVIFRTTGVSVSQSGEELAGTMDTTFGDFNTAWAGKTLGEFNSIWGTYTFLEFNLLWEGQTFADFNTRWAGLTFDNFNNQSGYQTFNSFATTPLLTDLTVED